jgi:dinuclear metal center YbgI/SA1388 family protein
MPTLEAIIEFLDHLAPTRLAEEWDNVGLLVGDRGGDVGRLMACLTITPATAAEAVAAQAELIVTHHPFPFRPLRRLTADTPTGRMLLELIGAGIAVYSPHTAFDSAAEGINQRLAEGLGLEGVAPLVPDEEGLGSGRCGRLGQPLRLGRLIERVKQFLCLKRVQYVGQLDGAVGSVAVACGSAAELIEPALERGCEAMLVGEARFHACLEAEAAGLALILPGHFASERFAVECLAGVLAERFPELEVWASREEKDPIGWA